MAATAASKQVPAEKRDWFQDIQRAHRDTEMINARVETLLAASEEAQRARQASVDEVLLSALFPR